METASKKRLFFSLERRLQARNPACVELVDGPASQSDVIYITARYPLRCSELVMFQVFKINEGGKHYIGEVATLKEATAQILSLAEFWPAQYAILDIEKGIWTSFPAYRTATPPSPRGGHARAEAGRKLEVRV